MADNTIVESSSVLTDEQRLALDGYGCELVPAEHDQKLAIVRLTAGQQVVEERTVTLDEHRHTRDLALLRTMLEYLNTGGSADRIRELAAEVSELPALQAPGYTLLGTYGRVDWTSYYSDVDGKLFEVIHGLFTNEISQEEFDDLVDERDTPPAPVDNVEPPDESSAETATTLQSETH